MGAPMRSMLEVTKMQMKAIVSAAVLGLVLTTAGTVSAHHSFAMFDNTVLTNVTGVVKSVDYTNPHSWV